MNAPHEYYKSLANLLQTDAAKYAVLGGTDRFEVRRKSLKTGTRRHGPDWAGRLDVNSKADGSQWQAQSAADEQRRRSWDISLDVTSRCLPRQQRATWKEFEKYPRRPARFFSKEQPIPPGIDIGSRAGWIRIVISSRSTTILP